MAPNGNIRKFYLMIADSVLLNCAVLVSLYLRFEGKIPDPYLRDYLRVALPFTAVSVGIFAALSLYTSSLRYASVDELLASFSGSALSGLTLFLIMHRFGNPAFPRTVVVIAGVLVFVFIGGSRISVRLAIRLGQKAQKLAGRGDQAIRVLVVGAGDAGAILGRELAKPSVPKREIVGYIDDDYRKFGSSIYGAKVLGGREIIPQAVRTNEVKEVVIAMPSAPGEVVRQVIEVCQGLGVKIKVFPHLLHLGESFHVDMIRDIVLADLLGRDEVEIDTGMVRASIAGKTVLVTGAGGSIGSEICMQVAGFGPKKIIALGHGENSVFSVYRRLKHQFPQVEIVTAIADVRDLLRVQEVFAEHQPQYVFHAAAHKHVPLMEESPQEAVKTNVFGTFNVAREALLHKTERFVMISTDKAVNPTSIMGVTKRVGENVVRLMSSLSDDTVFVCVRFGNVLGSRGSVVPIFKEQIERGGPVTVTHPDMTRYFMTIKEAVLLVLQAGTMGHGGEVMVLDMGAPVKITDLAENMIRLAGYVPHTEIPIVYTGIRPGEKLFEEMLTAEEGVTATHHSKIYVAKQNMVPVESCLRHLQQLERLCFPLDYPFRLFHGVVGQHDEDVLRETAAAAVLAHGSGNESGVVHGQEELVGILKLMVPSFRKDDDSSLPNSV